MGRVFYNTRFSNYLGENRAILDIVVRNVPDIQPSPTPTPSVTPSPTPTPSITPTKTVTPTPTVTISPTRTVTPTVTPTQTNYPICPEQFIITDSTGGNDFNGTYDRKYSYSGGSMTYGYYKDNIGYVGTAPDGFNYPVYRASDSNRFIFRRFNSSNVDTGFATATLAGDPWSTSGVGGVIIPGYTQTITQGDVRWLQGGLNTAPGHSFYLTYTPVCPTTTPTPSVTSTVTPTITPTKTATPTPTVTPSASPGPAVDPDAATYLAAVIAAGGTTNSTISGATDTFFTTLKAQGLYTKMIAFYPIIGGVSASHALNGIRANSVYDLTYSGGWTHTSTGQSPNGSNGYADTKYAIPAGTGFGSSEDLSFGIYLNNFNGTSGSFDLDIGTRIPDPDNTHIWWIGGEWGVTSSSRFAVENSSGSYTGTPSPSLYTICRIGSNIRMYKGNTLNTTTSYNGNNIGSSGSKFYLGCVSVGNTPQFFSRKNQCFVFISSGLDNTQAINLNNAINAYQTTLGRNSY